MHIEIETRSLAIKERASFADSLVLSVGFFLLVASGFAYGEIYGWKDSKGNVHFSDHRPEKEGLGLRISESIESQEEALFNQLRGEAGKRILKSLNNGDFYQYIPKSFDNAFAIVVVNHGMFSGGETAKDSAKNTSRRWQRFAEENGVIIVAPVFDNYRYAVTEEGPQKWGYRALFGRKVGADEFLNEILAYYQRANRYYDGKIFLSGHSAGAQFANRYLVRHPQRVRAAAFSAPAWFALPTYSFQWPNGMKRRYRVVRWPGELIDKVIDIPSSPSGWLKAAQLPVTVVVGEQDLEKLRSVEGVGGDTHVDRAKFWVNAMNEYAKENGASGRVELKIVEGVGHNFGKLAQVCQDSLKGEIRLYLSSERSRINR